MIKKKNIEAKEKISKFKREIENLPLHTIEDMLLDFEWKTIIEPNDDDDIESQSFSYFFFKIVIWRQQQQEQEVFSSIISLFSIYFLFKFTIYSLFFFVVVSMK